MGARDDVEALNAREWDRLRRPGTWFVGAQRVAIAAAARGDESGGDVLPRPAAEAAATIHDAPATITRAWVERLQADGLTAVEYVEILGIVARLRAIDTARFGLELAPRALPQPVDGPSSRETVDGAQLDGGWVPTVGAAFPTTVLSTVPAESDAMHDVHDTLYLAARAGDGHTMGNLAAVRDGLTRSQMEFVAARTSLLNDCFF